MNSNMTKEEAYAIGKMRVDNSLTRDEQEEIFALETTIQQHIERGDYLENYTYYGTYKEICKQHTEFVKEIQALSREIKDLRQRIKDIKSRAK